MDERVLMPRSVIVRTPTKSAMLLACRRFDCIGLEDAGFWDGDTFIPRPGANPLPTTLVDGHCHTASLH
jgi:hypothetical protein